MSHLLVFQWPEQVPWPLSSSTEQDIRSPLGGQQERWANGDACAPWTLPDEGSRLSSALEPRLLRGWAGSRPRPRVCGRRGPA